MRLPPSFAASKITASLHSTEPCQARTQNTVVCVHGTYANTVKLGKDGAVDWWRPGSGFIRELDAQLEAAGSSARCWSHLSKKAPFAWTGANTEGARREGGRALAIELEQLEQDARVERYHVVAHSHGGNVLLNALRELPERPRKLGLVVFMGTPALWFHHGEMPDIRWISVPMYLAGAGACGWTAHLATPDVEFYWGVAAGVFALSVGFELFFARRRRQRRQDDSLYGSGQPKAFVFEGDEAINGLITAQAIAAHPLRFIQKLAQSTPPGPPAVPPRSAPNRGIAEQMDESGIAAVLDLLSAPEPSPFENQYLGQLAPRLPGTLRHSVSAPKDPVPVPRVLITFLRSFDNLWGFKLSALLQVALWFLMLLPRLVVAAVVGVVAFVTAFVSMVKDKVLLVLAILVASWALPRLVRKGAMGADEGRFARVSSFPPGVVRHETLGTDAIAAARCVGSNLGGLAGGSMLGAIGSQDAFSIKRYIEEALSDAELTHSYYYKDPQIIAATAAGIAQLELPLHVDGSKPLSSTRPIATVAAASAPEA